MCRQHVLDDDWLPYISGRCRQTRPRVGRVFPSERKGIHRAYQMDRIIARDAEYAEIELKLRASCTRSPTRRNGQGPFPKQTDSTSRTAPRRPRAERIGPRRSDSASRRARAEAEAATVEGVEDEREAERKHERAAVADDQARERGRVASRRQGLLCGLNRTPRRRHGLRHRVGCRTMSPRRRCSAAASSRGRDGGEAQGGM
ncbi:MAG: hypothetical protein ACLT98_00425 [Eggerthellaceae bacterium]